MGTLSQTARPAEARRPPTGFFPKRRPTTAWSSSSLTTASVNTGTLSSRSGFVESDAAGSDLTLGEDGSLAGNPLGAVRRRRRQDPDDLSIRNLLRRSEAGAMCDDTERQATGARPCTPDVRINPAQTK